MSHHNRSNLRHALATVGMATLLATIAGSPMAFADDDLLRGPSVRQTAPPGGPSFSEMKDPFTRAAAGQPLPYRMFLMAVRTLEPNRAAPEVALSPEQIEAIRTVQREHNQALLRYIQLHRAELESLIARADLPQPRAMAPGRDQARPNARPNARPEARPNDLHNANPRQQRRQRNTPNDRGTQNNRVQDTPEAQARQQAMRLFAQLQFNQMEPSRDPAVNAARARLGELRNGAPSQDESRAKVWATLNEQQQQQVLAVIEKTYRERAERMRTQEMTDNQRPARPTAPSARPRDRRDATPERAPSRTPETRRPQRRNPDAEPDTGNTRPNPRRERQRKGPDA